MVNHLFCSAAGSTANGNHIVKERAISFSSEFSGSWTDSVRCTAPSLSPTTPPLASGQETVVGKCNATPRISGQCLRGRGVFCCDQSEPNAFCAIQLDSPPLNHRRLSIWYTVLRRGFHYPTHPAGSSTQSDSAVRLSSPGDLPSSAAFLSLWWQSKTHLSCMRRLLSSWQRMQSSRYLQPR